jgi:hypothetical protein
VLGGQRPDRAQQSPAHRATGDGGHPQHLAGGRFQGVQPGQDDRHQVGRQADVVRLGQGAGRHQLLGEERVSARPLMAPLDQSRVDPGAALRGHQFAHLIQGEGGQIDALGAAEEGGAAQQLPQQRGVVLDADRAIAAHQQETAALRTGLAQVPHQVESGRIGPVQILQGQHDRGVGADVVEHPADREEDLMLRGHRVAAEIEKLRQDPVRRTPEFLGAVGAVVAGKTLQRVQHRPVRHRIAEVLLGRPGQHVGARGPGLPEERAQHAALADAGLAADQHGPGRTRADAVQVLDEQRRLALTVDQRCLLGHVLPLQCAFTQPPRLTHCVRHRYGTSMTAGMRIRPL